MKKRIRLKSEIDWKTSLDKESGFWIGECEQLQLTASGETHSELVANIDELVHAVLSDLLKNGELEEFADLRGWKFDITEVPSSDGDEVDVPWRLNPVLDGQEAAVCY